MIEQLSRMKAWNEFVEWMGEQKYSFREKSTMPFDLPNKFVWNSRDISDRELLSLLVEFCDSKGYYIDLFTCRPLKAIKQNRFGWWLRYWDNGKWAEASWEYFNATIQTTRTEATQQAIIKCFELIGEGK